MISCFLVKAFRNKGTTGTQAVCFLRGTMRKSGNWKNIAEKLSFEIYLPVSARPTQKQDTRILNVLTVAQVPINSAIYAFAGKSKIEEPFEKNRRFICDGI